MNKTILYPLFFLLLFSGRLSVAQNRYADSLETLLHKVYKDSLAKQCQIYLDLAKCYQSLDTVKSLGFQKKAIAIVGQIDNEKAILQSYAMIARYYLNDGEYEEVIHYSDKALLIATKIGDFKSAAKLYFYIGSAYIPQGNSQKALDYFMLALKMADKAKDNDMKAHVNVAFGVVYQRQNQADSASVYFKRSLDYFEQKRDTPFIITGLVNVGGVLLTKSNYAEGQQYLKKALDITKQRRDKLAEVNVLYNIANGYQREGDLKRALEYATYSLKEAEENKLINLIIYSQALLANIKMDQKEYDDAIIQSKEGLALAYQEKILPIILSFYEMLILCYEYKKDYKHAFEYEQRSVHFRDSIAVTENNGYIEEIKQKYNLEKKDQELELKTALVAQVESSNKQKTVIIISLLVVVLSALISFLFYFQRRKIKEELALKNANYEKQSQYFKAFITGQEQERKRIASDLHDGLAQNLVMLKLGVAKFKLTDQEQQYKLVDYANQIDGMINETRKIAHDMMPDVLMDLGLQKALKSLVSGVNSNHSTLKTVVTVVEPFTKIESKIEIQLYRVVQELINNVIKHSEATLCEISLESTPSGLSLSFKDNGKGLVLDSKTNGIGLNNIHSRITSLNGTVQMNGQLNAGTQIEITIPIS